MIDNIIHSLVPNSSNKRLKNLSRTFDEDVNATYMYNLWSSLY